MRAGFSVSVEEAARAGKLKLKRQFGVTTYKAVKRNQSDAAVDVIKQYRLPLILATQVQTENVQANLWGGAQV